MPPAATKWEKDIFNAKDRLASNKEPGQKRKIIKTMENHMTEGRSDHAYR